MNGLDLLRCPVTREPLELSSDGTQLTTEDGGHVYPVKDGIAGLLTASGDDEKEAVRAFYEEVGWRAEGEDEEVFEDTARFVGRRPELEPYLAGCRLRLGAPLPATGDVLLDIASGPVQFAEYVAYQDGYRTRVCVDLSVVALRRAQPRVGEKGVFVQGDITNIPLADASVDAAICLHTIYHVPRDQQPAAFLELHRVLKPGGVAVVAYSWGHTAWGEMSWPRRLIHLPSRLLRRVARGRRRPASAHTAAQAEGAEPELYFHAYDHQWFTDQRWPFRYEIRAHRLFTIAVLERIVSLGRIGRGLLAAIDAAEDRFPRLCGRLGRYPLIVIHKD